MIALYRTKIPREQDRKLADGEKQRTPVPAARDDRLEEHLHRKLCLSRAGRCGPDENAAGCKRSARPVEELGPCLWGGGVIYVVEYVEELCAELNIEGFRNLRDPRVLDKRGVEGIQAGTEDGVTAGIAQTGEPCHGIKGREGEAINVNVLPIEGSNAPDRVAGTTCAGDAIREGKDVVAVQIKGISTDERRKWLAGAVLEDACPLPTIEQSRSHGYALSQVREFNEIVEYEVSGDIKVRDATAAIGCP
jgi:hypothetical protein